MKTEEPNTRNRTIQLVIHGESRNSREHVRTGTYRYYLEGFYDAHNEVVGIEASNDIELAERVYMEAVQNCPQGIMDVVEHIDYGDGAITSWVMVVYCSSQEIATALEKSVRNAVEKEALSINFTTTIYDMVAVSVVPLTELKVAKLLKGTWKEPDRKFGGTIRLLV